MSKSTYEKDTEQNEKYSKNSSGDDIVEHGRYAKNKDNQTFYPSDKDGNEFKDPNLGYIKKNGIIVLPLNGRGKPIYEIVSGDETYPTDNGKYIIGYGRDGHQYYAQKANHDEIYPPDNTFARKSDGCKYYATKSNGDTVFPIDKDRNEFYMGLVDPDNIHTIPSKYARDKDSNEFYPKTKTVDNLESEIILLYAYAQKSGGHKFYPKDAFNNEFYLPEKQTNKTAIAIANRLLPRYAVTNDLKVILPELDGKFHISATSTYKVVANTNILGLLVREKNKLSGYLTNVEDTTVTPKPEARDYKYQALKHKRIIEVTVPGSKPPKPVAIVSPTYSTPNILNMAQSTGSCSLKPFYKSWYFWVLVIVSLIIKSFAIWWFFLKNQKSYFTTR